MSDMNGWAELRQARPAPIVIPSAARPIRVALAGPLDQQAASVVTALVAAINKAYRAGVVVLADEPTANTGELAEGLRRVLPGDLVARARTDDGGEAAATASASAERTASAVARQVAALESLEDAHPDLAVVLVVGGEPARSPLFATGTADLTITFASRLSGESAPPEATAREAANGESAAPEAAATATAPPERAAVATGGGPDRQTYVVSDRSDGAIAGVVAWLEQQLERYRRAWSGVPGVERLRPRSDEAPAALIEGASAPLDQRRGKLPRYDYECKACDTRFDVERPMSEASSPYPCPFCGGPTRRVFSAPKLMFKADPRDNRPVWHNHGSYGHSHAPGRGRHRTPSEDH